MAKGNQILKTLWSGIRLTISSSIYIATAVMTLIYLLSAFSPYIPPRTLAFPTLLGLAFPVILLGQVLCFLYWVVRMRWRVLITLTIIFIITWGQVSAYIPLNRNLSERLESYQGKRLKVLSYNVCGFGFMHHKPQRPNNVLLYLKSSNADIICLQEASLASHPSWGLTIGQVKRYLGEEYPYMQIVASQKAGSMLMLLSRYPIKSAKRLDIKSRTNGAAHFVVNIGGQETHIINVHLESFRLRSAQGKEYMELVAKGDAIGLKDALNTQLTPIFKIHNRQANAIYKYLRDIKSDRVIVCGDFNDTPISYTHRKIGEDLQDAFIESGNGLGYSFISRTFLVRIDHIMVGQAFEPYYTKVDAGVRGSDHYPIYTYLRPKN